MDICSHIGFTVNDVNNLHGFCLDVNTLESSYELMGDFSVDKLAYGAAKFLNIQDDEELVSGLIPNQSEKITEACGNIFDKCDTFSCLSEISSSSAASAGAEFKGGKNDGVNVDVTTNEALKHDDNDKYTNSYCSNASSLPNPLKPISAMKGSREKNGLTPRKHLTVTWAPDVYDPVPTPSLHMVSNRPHRHGKKKSKSKQKDVSKSSRGSKSKDKDKNKKQVRKRSASDMGFKLCENKEEVIQIKPSAIDFHLGMPDRFCGGSFANRYGSSMHMSSVAEAT